MAARGPKSSYTRKYADLICDRLAAGEGLAAICRDEGYPSEVSVRRWAQCNIDGFSTNYARARELQAECFADQLIAIADDGTNDWMQREVRSGRIEVLVDREHVERSKLRFQARQWVISKILPKKYGDKATEPNPESEDEVARRHHDSLKDMRGSVGDASVKVDPSSSTS